MEATIRGLRPNSSDSTLEISSEMASAAVEIDRARLLWAGVRAKSRASTGISGCTL